MEKQKVTQKVVLALIFIHLAILVVFISANGNPQRPDSQRYKVLADSICNDSSFSGPNIRYRTGDPRVTVQKDSFSGHQNLNEYVPEVLRTPGYPAFICGMEKLGLDSDYAMVTIQLGLFILSVFLIHHLVKRIYGTQLANLITLAMLATPGGLVYSLTLYSEVIFLLVFSTALLCCFWYIKSQTLSVLIVSSAAFALSFYIKPSVLYLPFLISLVLLFFYRQLTRKVFLHVPFFLALFLMGISPWLIRNQHHYQTPYISGQLSNMLAVYHLPAVWAETEAIEEQNARLKARSAVDLKVLEKEAENNVYLNSVQIFDLQQKYAMSELAKYPVVYAKQWLLGMWESVWGDYTNRLYFLMIGEKIPWGQSGDYEERTDQPGALMKIVQMTAKVAVKLEQVFWITAFILASTALLRGIWKLDPIAYISAICIAFFLFIPGTMGYSRFRFPIEWLMLLYAISSLIAMHSSAFPLAAKSQERKLEVA